MSSISKNFQSVGLSLNIDKCEYLVFNAKSMPICLPCSVRCVSELGWLGIHICSNLLTLTTNIVRDAKEKLKVGYCKILTNRGH